MVSFRSLLIASTLFFAVSYAALGQSPPPKKGAKMSNALVLSASLFLKGDHLVLDYKVTNGSTSDVYLLNRLYKTTPTWVMSPDIIYIHLDRKTKTVWLYKKLADLPATGVTAPVAPYVTPVRAGGTFREQVRIPLPVSEYSQYTFTPTAHADPSSVQTFKNVYFSLGYYWKPDGTIEDDREIQGTPVIFPRTPPGKPLQFGQLHTDPVHLDIPVQLPRAGIVPR